jgi:hypothetical protein
MNIGLEDELREMWSRPLAQLPVYKDLPRLVGRISINESAQHQPGSLLTRNDKGVALMLADERWGECKLEPVSLSVFDKVSATALRLVTVLEPETAATARKRVQGITTAVVGGSDMELAMPSLFDAIGPDSKTARVLKCVHQGLVLTALSRLRTKIPQLPMTKDVRTPDGWRIQVRANKRYIQVAHIRREQSIDAFGDTSQHFDFAWELCLTFDTDMKELNAAHLKVLSRGVGKDTRQSFVHRLDRTILADMRVA